MRLLGCTPRSRLRAAAVLDLVSQHCSVRTLRSAVGCAVVLLLLNRCLSVWLVCYGRQLQDRAGIEET